MQKLVQNKLKFQEFEMQRQENFQSESTHIRSGFNQTTDISRDLGMVNVEAEEVEDLA